ncbi:MAG: lipid-binding SYLF domain-containing protein [Sphingomonas sp.]
MKQKSSLLLVAAVAALSACSGTTTTTDQNAAADNAAGAMVMDNGTTAGQASDQQNLVDEATAEVQDMKKDPQLAKLLAKAKGVYLVPEFGRGALIVGGRGGAGVVLAKQTTGWTGPAFYNFGGLSLGAQAGGSGGRIAFLLMSDDAVNAFKSGNKVTLNADSGLSIINYSANAQASWGKGDIIMWSDTSGAYAGATISVTDLNSSGDSDQKYYGKQVAPDQILNGTVTAPQAAPLQQALPS